MDTRRGLPGARRYTLVSAWAALALLVVTALLLLAEPAYALTEIKGWTIKAALPSKEPSPPVITCTAAFLIDADTGEYLFSHNANARLPMASTTKIMTAVLALESLDLDARVKISQNAVSTIGSKSKLVAGEVLTVEQLLHALMVVSGNDASIALAEATSGSVGAFVEKMNAKAKSLGLTNTHFVNPCGLNNKKHFSSAKDLAFLTQYALRDPVFSRIVDTIYFSLPPLEPVPPAVKGELRDFDNQNELLKRRAWVTGVKTGSTPYAKSCLVASGTMEDVDLIAVILGAKDSDTRWKEAQALLEYGFSLYPRMLLSDTGQLVVELDIGDYLGRKVRLVTDGPLVARLSRNDVVECRPALDGEVTFPVHAGDRLGTIEFTVRGESLGSLGLVAAQSVERPPIQTVLERWMQWCPPQLRLGG
ncbi:MAG: D-alanyl-D-alanine carboxypeptidase [Thermoleophilia bacterium]|nr:D-alanyl-D-alanine carboxypeptidase [Thermoleophilia bacterium]